MPWVLAVLRGQKVYARARADGSFEAEGGRVEIRYKPTDSKAYRAAANNLTLVPGGTIMGDDACVPGTPVGPRGPTGATSGTDSGVEGATTQRKSASKSGKASAASSSARAGEVAAEWIAYTDGACSGNPGPAGSGMVVIAPGGKIHEGFEYLGSSSTNNVAELTGILRAVEAIPVGARSIAIHTDSKYAIGVLSKGWKAKANQELIAKARAVLATRTNVALVYVPGHAGVPLNERADELAREAVRRGRSQPLPRDL